MHNLVHEFYGSSQIQLILNFFFIENNVAVGVRG